MPKKGKPTSPQLGWIWPKDPRPGNPKKWPKHWRFLDVLQGKGPDIYVGTIKDPKSKSESNHNNQHENENETMDPHTHSQTYSHSHSQSKTSPSREEWTRWNIDPKNEEGEAANYSLLPWVKRKPGERYDFRTRTYAVPNRATWSRVEFCDGPEKGKWYERREVHRVPRRYWDPNGEIYPAENWHDNIYGAHDD
ncbi:uncharacterized protein N7511_009653 [Penicillium nucicola]|uniref:uncharacterized protein n=1 Tax=Penicillium nucicola TaxID=1850975 RepID=UPI0025453D8F|nr:uncharacterized protein N7511_009653 [Penicillium nucicola]KAJ5747957.1 hypothetical protein N7511_009653 [Penicillium nucicola]